jgi:hypothetical protein
MSDPMDLMRRLCPALLLAGLLLPAAGHAVRAAPDGELSPGERFDRGMQQAQKLFEQGLETMVGSVQELLRAIPRYELPQVNEHGDIIIRRKPPSELPGGAAEPPGGRTI